MSSCGGESNQCSSSRQTRKRALEPEEDKKSGNQPFKYRLPNRSAGARTMLNQIVLAKVAIYLPAGVLFELRRTCRSWSSYFVPQLRKVHAIKLMTCDRKSGDFAHFIQSSTGIPPFTRFEFTLYEEADDENVGLEPFHVLTRQFGCHVTNLAIIVSENINFSISQLRTMIMDYLPCLMDLTLELEACGSNHNPNPSTPTPIGGSGREPETSPKSISLKRIKVGYGFVPYSKAPVANPDYVRLVCDMIRRANGLEELQMAAGPLGDDDADLEQGHDLVEGDLVGKTLTALLDLDCQHINVLKKLRLMTALKISDLHILTQLANTSAGGRSGLELECFHAKVLRIDDVEVDWFVEDQPDPPDYQQLVYDFLATQSPTLKKLGISLDFDGDLDAERLASYIPPIDHLEELEIQGSSLHHDDLHFTKKWKGKLVQTFPELKTFSYVNANNVDQLDLTDNLDRLFHPGVTHLILETGLENWVWFERFESTFPSITRLDLTLLAPPYKTDHDDDVLDVKKLGPKLWTTWPGLTHIKLHIGISCVLDMDLDSLLSGVPRVGLEHLRHQFAPAAKGELTLDSIRQNREKYKTRPSISNLKHLQELSITFQIDVNSWTAQDDYLPQLTDIGGYFGLALANVSLQRVVLSRYGRSLVSEHCLDFLRHIFGPAVEISL